VNVGRGDLISVPDLIKALDSKWIGGAILDVLGEDPLPKDNPLWTYPNVVITQHISAYTAEDRPSKLVEFFLTNLNRFLTGQPLLNPINWEEGY